MQPGLGTEAMSRLLRDQIEGPSTEEEEEENGVREQEEKFRIELVTAWR